MVDSITITRALISVSDKTGLLPLATSLRQMGVVIVASGGTADFLNSNNIETEKVEDATAFPEILGGRVKTLHPAIHGGILARPDNPNDTKDLAKHNIQKFDMVVVNLYPFASALEKKLSATEMIEEIDIGGVALIRAAAKNFSSVAVVADPADYNMLMGEMEKNKSQTSLSLRKKLATTAFRHIADYDEMIANWFAGEATSAPSPSAKPLLARNESPSTLGLATSSSNQSTSTDHQPSDSHLPKNSINLRYGENPHQVAEFLTDKKFGLGAMQQSQGKDLSYNNYLDADAVLRLLINISPLNEAAAVIVKHNDPCGVAVFPDIATAFLKALDADRMSAFGGIVGLNRKVDKNIAATMLEQNIFFEMIIAPDFSPDAKELLSARKDLRLLSLPSFATPDQEKQYRSVVGGVLMQGKDDKIISKENCSVMSKAEPSPQEWQDMILAMMVAKEMRSNAIAIVAGGCTMGLGGGATSRVMAIKKAMADYVGKKENSSTAMDGDIGIVAASDGFLPFVDNVEEFASLPTMPTTGGAKTAKPISAIIQPGGSINDKKIIAACDEKNIKLVFCHSRHFHH